jgi:hypothetical protein
VGNLLNSFNRSFPSRKQAARIAGRLFLCPCSKLCDLHHRPENLSKRLLTKKYKKSILFVVLRILVTPKATKK